MFSKVFLFTFDKNFLIMEYSVTFFSNAKRNNICFVFLPTFAYFTSKTEYSFSFVWLFLEINFKKVKSFRHYE